MSRVKICGITNLSDAMDSIDAGADALGFVFYKPSPRYISPMNAKNIIEKLPPFVQSVGLFVNESASFINSTCKEANINLAQLHFEVEDDFLSELEIPYICVVRVKNEQDLLKYEDNYRLVDAFVEGYGGKGKQINPNWFEKRDCSKMIVAGGLNVENVKELRNFGFYGFDVSSGVEKSKGNKDKNKLFAFIDEVKS